MVPIPIPLLLQSSSLCSSVPAQFQPHFPRSRSILGSVPQSLLSPNSDLPTPSIPIQPLPCVSQLQPQLLPRLQPQLQPQPQPQLQLQLQPQPHFSTRPGLRSSLPIWPSSSSNFVHHCAAEPHFSPSLPSPHHAWTTQNKPQRQPVRT